MHHVRFAKRETPPDAFGSIDGASLELASRAVRHQRAHPITDKIRKKAARVIGRPSGPYANERPSRPTVAEREI